MRILAQVKELVTSNVTSALDAASNPAKMLGLLQGEIEEALIGLTGEISKTKRQKERLDTDIAEAKAREADWADKARLAMDNGREDLARQALLVREECRETIATLKKEQSELGNELAEMETAEKELEAKREDVRTRRAEQAANGDDASKDASPSKSASPTEKRMDHIANLEKRTEFASDRKPTDASVENEIEAMRRERAVADELEALKSGKRKAPAKKRTKRS